MASVRKLLYQGVLTNSAATVYTVPARTSTVVRHMTAVNYSGGDVTVTLYRNGTANANLILPATTVPSGDLHEWDGEMSLGPTEYIAAVAGSNTAIVLTIDGEEIS